MNQSFLKAKLNKLKITNWFPRTTAFRNFVEFLGSISEIVAYFDRAGILQFFNISTIIKLSENFLKIKFSIIKYLNIYLRSFGSHLNFDFNQLGISLQIEKQISFKRFYFNTFRDFLFPFKS